MDAVRTITLVMGKISYEDKARIETLRKLGFEYRTIVAKFFWKRVGSIGVSNKIYNKCEDLTLTTQLVATKLNQLNRAY